MHSDRLGMVSPLTVTGLHPTSEVQAILLNNEVVRMDTTTFRAAQRSIIQYTCTAPDHFHNDNFFTVQDLTAPFSKTVNHAYRLRPYRDNQREGLIAHVHHRAGG
ncbi:hypothetical protein PHMEG_00023461 [Phytophthora megakarya]|uniref:Uncharacterized protein n=1 Tax=Phytophthora megakarya TaxID=4795 RepID=A0A225VIC8_9STRA|nr:hypothetical protein PHMEG_00023461 [Phytophthora megakarya]